MDCTTTFSIPVLFGSSTRWYWGFSLLKRSICSRRAGLSSLDHTRRVLPSCNGFGVICHATTENRTRTANVTEKNSFIAAHSRVLIVSIPNDRAIRKQFIRNDLYNESDDYHA